MHFDTSEYQINSFKGVWDCLSKTAYLIICEYFRVAKLSDLNLLIPETNKQANSFTNHIKQSQTPYTY